MFLGVLCYLGVKPLGDWPAVLPPCYNSVQGKATASGQVVCGLLSLVSSPLPLGQWSMVSFSDHRLPARRVEEMRLFELETNGQHLARVIARG